MSYKRGDNWTEEMKQRQSEICRQAFEALPEDVKAKIREGGRDKLLGNQFNRQWTDEALAELERLYWEEGLSLRDIAEKLGKSQGAINSIFNYYSIPRREHSESAACYHRKKGTECISGENNSNWRGGTCYEPYTAKFFEIQEQIRERDNYTCQICGVSQAECFRALNVHHIDYNKKNTNETNLISLCDSCHSPTQTNRSYWVSYFMDLLHERGVI